jgi:hypothetical protein
LFQRLQADMQRLQPMHLIESASIPYRRVSASATVTDPSAAATGAPATNFRKRRLSIFAGGFSIAYYFSSILPVLF